jgi:hypothetical protein
MQRIWKRTKLGVAAMVLAVMALSAAPAGAYCNQDPCGAFETRTCSMCTWVEDFGWYSCRYTLIYCVDCRTGDFFSWEESEEYCTYNPI